MQLCPEATAGAPMRKAAWLWTNDFVHENVNSDRWVGMCFLLALPNWEQVSLKTTSSVMTNKIHSSSLKVVIVIFIE